jgi:hypothetical protein
MATHHEKMKKKPKKSKVISKADHSEDVAKSPFRATQPEVTPKGKS